jgi:serine/threonine protein kinase
VQDFPTKVRVCFLSPNLCDQSWMSVRFQALATQVTMNATLPLYATSNAVYFRRDGGEYTIIWGSWLENGGAAAVDQDMADRWGARARGLVAGGNLQPGALHNLLPRRNNSREEWAHYIAQLTNFDRLKSIGPGVSGERVCEQHLFPAASGLLCAFSPTPNLYCADTTIWTTHTFVSRQNDGIHPHDPSTGEGPAPTQSEPAPGEAVAGPVGQAPTEAQLGAASTSRESLDEADTSPATDGGEAEPLPAAAAGEVLNVAAASTATANQELDPSPQPIQIRPDAGIKASTNYYALALMEVKPHYSEDVDRDDMRKCVMFACASALAIRERQMLLEIRERDMLLDIIIPFVIGNPTASRLYVIHLAEESSCPVLRFVAQADFNRKEQRVPFIERMAAVLYEVSVFAQEGSRYLRSFNRRASPTRISSYLQSSYRTGSQPGVVRSNKRFRTETDPNSARDSPPLPGSFPLCVLQGVVYYVRANATRVMVWNGELVVELDDELENDAQHLINADSGVYEADELLDLIPAHRDADAWAHYVALLTNMDRPVIDNGVDGERVLEQHVFPPATGLLYSFCADRGLYCAKTSLHSADTIEEGREVNIQPNAGIRATPLYYALAAMMISSRAGASDKDRIEIVLFMCMSALTVRKLGIEGTIKIPFVICDETMASLYTVTLPAGLAEQEVIPEVRLRYDADFDITQERVHFMARLTILLWAITVLANEIPDDLEDLDAIRVPSGRPQYNFKSKTAAPATASPTRESVLAVLPSANVTGLSEAVEVASCQGEVTDIELLLFHTGSPDHYFVGCLQNEQVFIKVWLEGGENTNQKMIDREIDLQKRAHECGIPCSNVVHRLSSALIGCNHRRLVMERLSNDDVSERDLGSFAISFVRAVLNLNHIGILHCDLKPANVVWDKRQKVASLVDFGHAQDENGAASYVGTAGYTAPEVAVEGRSHDQLSEAYSVGKTLLEIAYILEQDERCPVIIVAKQLCREERSKRITLQEALAQWDAQPTLPTVPPKKNSPGSVMTPIC